MNYGGTTQEHNSEGRLRDENLGKSTENKANSMVKLMDDKNKDKYTSQLKTLSNLLKLTQKAQKLKTTMHPSASSSAAHEKAKYINKNKVAVKSFDCTNGEKVTEDLGKTNGEESDDEKKLGGLDKNKNMFSEKERLGKEALKEKLKESGIFKKERRKECVESSSGRKTERSEGKRKEDVGKADCGSGGNRTPGWTGREDKTQHISQTLEHNGKEKKENTNPPHILHIFSNLQSYITNQTNPKPHTQPNPSLNLNTH